MARFLFCFWFNGNGLAIAQTFFEFYNACNLCKQCMILAHTNIQAWVHRCATLANNDITWDNTAATGFFNAQSASGRVASISGRRTCFLVCHN